MQNSHHPIPESYWVEPDRLLAGEYPGSFDLEITRHRMDAFLEFGITTFIDLTHSHEREPYEAILKEQARAYGLTVTYQRISIQDYGTPSRETMMHTLDSIDSALASGQKIYVHCWGGVGRTGTTVGCYLVRHGKTGEQALDQIAEWWQNVPKHDRYARSPETDEQCEFIRNWREVPTYPNR
ncbi:MAG: dual specificity protein phosphatase family protein [Anaerolineales bacterium]|nr:dual specificity protein phosphatase family protein [Anaerolineales bacterium]